MADAGLREFEDVSYESSDILHDENGFPSFQDEEEESFASNFCRCGADRSCLMQSNRELKQANLFDIWGLNSNSESQANGSFSPPEKKLKVSTAKSTDTHVKKRVNRHAHFIRRFQVPLRRRVLNYVVKVTKNCLKKQPKTLVVVGAYSIGKECVFLAISKALGSFDWPEFSGSLCTQGKDTLLHVLPISSLKFETWKDYLKTYTNQYSAVLAFRPTGVLYSETKASQNCKSLFRYWQNHQPDYWTQKPTFTTEELFTHLINR